jgi:hypothetical protein
MIQWLTMILAKSLTVASTLSSITVKWEVTHQVREKLGCMRQSCVADGKWSPHLFKMGNVMSPDNAQTCCCCVPLPWNLFKNMCMLLQRLLVFMSSGTVNIMCEQWRINDQNGPRCSY